MENNNQHRNWENCPENAYSPEFLAMVIMPFTKGYDCQWLGAVYLPNPYESVDIITV
ncbi:MAG: hypothetical protein NUV82_00845 [Candidatus Komeilibacteria bacterium]|nr:hypothetical protein [Candidatus Komeilibacteria bacterium]